MTALNSTGLGDPVSGLGTPDDLPLFPSLESLLRVREENHCTLLAIVPDSFPIDQMAKAVEEVVGRLNSPDTGILFVMPVERTWGLRP
ncbi:MAG: hypothetical protein MUO23_09035 [Anaerolineales bacterium]|nr:hypothetical protein [Anaerolineales bacterium]